MLKLRASLKILVALLVIVAGIYSLPNTARATIPNQKIIYSEYIYPEGGGSATGRISSLNPENLNKEPVVESYYANIPSFSPDGNKIMYYYATSQSDARIVISNPDGSNPQDILQDFNGSDGEEVFYSLPQWGSNSKLYFAAGPKDTYGVNYSSSSAEDGYLKIYSVNVDGSNLTELYKLTPESDKDFYITEDIDFNATTNSIVFYAKLFNRNIDDNSPDVVANDTKIYSLDLDSLTINPLVTAPSGKYLVRAPNLSPDGKSLIYTEDDIGDTQGFGILKILNLQSGQTRVIQTELFAIPGIEFNKPDQIWSQDSSKVIIMTYDPNISLGVYINILDLNTDQVSATGYKTRIPFAIFTNNDSAILASILTDQGADLALIDISINNHVNLTNEPATLDFWADIYPRNIDTDVEINNPPPDLSNIKPPRTGESAWVYVSLFGVFGLMILVGYSSVRFTNKLLYRNKGVR